MTSGLQQKDNALFQVISQLIDALRQFVVQTTSVIGNGGGGGGGGGAISNPTYITINNETGQLPNSRRLVFGDFINFDLNTPGEIIINGSEWSVLTDGDPNAGTEYEWSVLTDGDLVNPQLIFANGDVIMTHIRVPAPGIIFDGNGDVIMTHVP